MKKILLVLLLSIAILSCSENATEPEVKKIRFGIEVEKMIINTSPGFTSNYVYYNLSLYNNQNEIIRDDKGENIIYEITKDNAVAVFSKDTIKINKTFYFGLKDIAGEIIKVKCTIYERTSTGSNIIKSFEMEYSYPNWLPTKIPANEFQSDYKIFDFNIKGWSGSISYGILSNNKI